MQYKSTQSGEVLTGLDDYITRMKEGQKGIYFVTAESDALAANSPFVENLEKKGMEVRPASFLLWGCAVSPVVCVVARHVILDAATQHSKPRALCCAACAAATVSSQEPFVRRSYSSRDGVSGQAKENHGVFNRG